MNKMIEVIIINEHEGSSQWWLTPMDSIDSAKAYVARMCQGREDYEVVSDNQHHFKVKYRQKGFDFYTTTTAYFNECFPF